MMKNCKGEIIHNVPKDISSRVVKQKPQNHLKRTLITFIGLGHDKNIKQKLT